MDKNIEMRSKLVRLGAADLGAGDVEAAVRRYERALVLAVRLIDDTIITFEGDVRPLHLYSTTCYCMVALYVQTGHSSTARLCLEQAGRTFLSVLKNSAYPQLMRGKVIREFEPLMNLAIQFFESEGRPDEAYSAIGNWLVELKQYVGRMRPIEETVLMN